MFTRSSIALIALSLSQLVTACTTKSPPAISNALEEAGQEITFWVVLNEQADLRPSAAMRNWRARGDFVHQTLRNTARASQARLQALLRARGAKFQSFWIVNTLQVTGNTALMHELLAQPEVARIAADEVFVIPEPLAGTPQAVIDEVEWGIANIRAHEVWGTYGFRGEGIVIAHIDTGVAYDHAALVTQYRGNLGDGSFDHNYNWFDPSSVCDSPSLVPCDHDGHGSHTMGSMVGDDGDGNRIGAAPAAKWITAIGCDTDSCSSAALLASAEWVLAPTDLAGANPRPDLRPHIVSNSWGSTDGASTFFQPVIQSWVAAGMFPVFANGNSGPDCQTVASPASYPESYGVGAYDIGNTIASWSSRGASPIDGSVKPNISAPGVNVRSAWNTIEYRSISGTSMAAPHLSGAVALLWSGAPALVGDIAATRAVLNQSAIDVPIGNCGSNASTENNNTAGEGRLDAFEAVRLSPMGPMGTVAGTVLDAANEAPLADTTITFVGPVSRVFFGDSAGQYSALLPAGSFDVTIRAFDQVTDTVAGVIVGENSTTALDFTLAVAQAHALDGFVRDDVGAPIAGATVTIRGTPILPAVSDSTGYYRFGSVPASTYDVRAHDIRPQQGPCNERQTHTVIVGGATSVDFALRKRKDAFGHTCRVVIANYVTADGAALTLSDSSAQLVDLPFAFPFYGKVYSSAYVASDGHITFQSTNFSNNFNQFPPYRSTPNAAIYAFWDELKFGSTGSVHVGLIGTQPNRQLVIEWRRMIFGFHDEIGETPAGEIDFEVLLGEDGSILMQYRDIDQANVYEQGRSATFGIENAEGTVAFAYAYLKPILDGPTFAVRYSTETAIAPDSVHVGDVDGSVTSGKKRSWTASVTTEVHDATHLPLAGALVSGTFSGAFNGDVTCTTDNTGRCQVATATIGKKDGRSVVFSVQNLTQGASYLAGANHDPDGDSNGTSITLTR